MQVDVVPLNEIDLDQSETIACFVKIMADEVLAYRIDNLDEETVIGLLTGLGHRRDFVRPLIGRIISSVEKSKEITNGSQQGTHSFGDENHPAN